METETKQKVDTKKIIITLLLVLLTAAAVGGGVYYVLNQNFQREREVNEKALEDLQNTVTENSGATVETKKEPTTATPTAVSANIYKNSDYGFQLTFPESWKGYKLYETKVEGITKTWYVQLPTTDPNWSEGSSTAEKGYASVFAISAYTDTEWADEQAGPAPATGLGKIGNYNFGYSMSQASPSDISAIRRSEVKAIAETLKVSN